MKRGEIVDNSPLCSPKNTNLNLRNGLPKSPDEDILSIDH